MSTASRIGRLGTLAVGLGIGTALATIPGTASATTDFDISIDGFDLFNGGGSAHAVSGLGDLAIAIGPDTNAFAEGGFGDFASAFGTGVGATAVAGDIEQGATGNNFDFASATGNFSDAEAGNTFGGSGPYPDTVGSSFDVARAVGGDGQSAPDDAFAGFNGSGDYASAIGENIESTAGYSDDPAAPANFDWADVSGNLNATPATLTDALAGGGFGGLGGSHDLAFILDPFGTVGSEAVAGLGHNFDLAGVLGDDLTAMSTLADSLFHIAPLF